LALGAVDGLAAVAVAHPGNDVDFPADFEKVKHPTLFICAERDPWFPDSQRDGGKEILEKGLWNKFRVFPDTDHGFGVCRWWVRLIVGEGGCDE
jgi:dienelactone hydrolase